MSANDSTSVVPFNDRSVAYTVMGQEVKLTPNMVRQYLVTGNRELVTDQEIVYFMHICKSRGLNPFNKDCYLIKYTQAEGAAIIVSIEKLRMVARQSEDCVGWEKGVIVKKENGELRYSKGLVLEGEVLLGGYFKAKPKTWEHPFEIEVNLKGYIKKTRDGAVTRFWSPDNQPTMIAKVAEAQGLRTLWPEKTQGLYVSEEINNEQHPIDVDFSMVSPDSGPSELPAIFDAAALEQGVDPNTLQAFIHFVAVTAEGNKMSVDDFKAKVINEKHFDKLWGVFLTTLPGKAPDTTKAPRTRRTKAEIEAEKAANDPSRKAAAAAVESARKENTPDPAPPAPPAPPPTALNGNPIEHTEEWGVMADLKRNNQQGYLQAKIDLKIPQGPRTLDDVNAIIGYLEKAMRIPGQEG